ncbi:MAG: prolipoprotein diacylglyceryl transferase [Mycoplasmataceae bacterium]|nr:prolipoprotein diacylglyceryl transferase [Mycoplasmataceae bacterium]
MFDKKRRNKIWFLASSSIVIFIVIFSFLFVCLYSRQIKASEESKTAFIFLNSKVQWYAIFIFFGFISAIALSCLKIYKNKLPIEPLYYFTCIAVPCAIFGARLGSCIIGQTSWNEFFHNFGSGLAIEWGILFVVFIACIFFPLILRNEKYFFRDETNEEHIVLRQVSFWNYVDVVMPTIFIGQILGRFGNYFNQEIYGPVVKNENMINFLQTFFPWMYIENEWRTPVFFYEQIGNLSGILTIYFGCEFITNKKIRKCGNLGILYIVWYGIVRALMTPLRMNGGGSDGETMNMITTYILITGGIILLILNTFVFYKYTRNKRIIWFSFLSIGIFFKMLFNHSKKQIYQNEYTNIKKEFVKKPNEMLWYNNF